MEEDSSTQVGASAAAEAEVVARGSQQPYNFAAASAVGGQAGSKQCMLSDRAAGGGSSRPGARIPAADTAACTTVKTPSTDLAMGHAVDPAAAAAEKERAAATATAVAQEVAAATATAVAKAAAAASRAQEGLQLLQELQLEDGREHEEPAEGWEGLGDAMDIEDSTEDGCYKKPLPLRQGQEGLEGGGYKDSGLEGGGYEGETTAAFDDLLETGGEGGCWLQPAAREDHANQQCLLLESCHEPVLPLQEQEQQQQQQLEVAMEEEQEAKTTKQGTLEASSGHVQEGPGPGKAPLPKVVLPALRALPTRHFLVHGGDDVGNIIEQKGPQQHTAAAAAAGPSGTGGKERHTVEKRATGQAGREAVMEAPSAAMVHSEAVPVPVVSQPTGAADVGVSQQNQNRQLPCIAKRRHKYQLLAQQLDAAAKEAEAVAAEAAGDAQPPPPAAPVSPSQPAAEAAGAFGAKKPSALPPYSSTRELQVPQLKRRGVGLTQMPQSQVSRGNLRLQKLEPSQVEGGQDQAGMDADLEDSISSSSSDEGEGEEHSQLGGGAARRSQQHSQLVKPVVR